MRHLKLGSSILFLAGSLFLFIACQKNSLADAANELSIVHTPDQAELDRDLLQYRHGTHEIPFKATFYTNRVPELLGEVDCLLPEYQDPNYQRGGGQGTHLGKFKTVLTFCSTAGGFYGGGSGYLEAANGDRLYIKIPSGQVKLPLPEPHPVYDAYFKDEFLFDGGTGRFAGASGSGTTNSLVDLWNEDYPPGPVIIPDHRTDHVWTGTLILPNANKRKN